MSVRVLGRGASPGDPGGRLTQHEQRIDRLISRLDDAVGVADELVAHGIENWYQEPIHRFAGRGVVSTIGELAKQFPKEVTRGTNEVPWREWAGMRNLLVHLSSNISDDMVWNTLEQAVPDVHHSVHRWRERQWELGRFGGPERHLGGPGLER